MRWLSRYFDPSFQAARQRALEHMRARNPSFTLRGTRLCAEEPSRWVFAVFYQQPGVRTRPDRYQLIAVARDGDAVEDLETSPGSPYWIRGRK